MIISKDLRLNNLVSEYKKNPLPDEYVSVMVVGGWGCGVGKRVARIWGFKLKKKKHFLPHLI